MRKMYVSRTHSSVEVQSVKRRIFSMENVDSLFSQKKHCSAALLRCADFPCKTRRFAKKKRRSAVHQTVWDINVPWQSWGHSEHSLRLPRVHQSQFLTSHGYNSLT